MKPWLHDNKKRIIAILIGLLALVGLYWYGGYSGDSHGFTVSNKDSTDDYKIVMNREYTLPSNAYAPTNKAAGETKTEVATETATEATSETTTEQTKETIEETAVSQVTTQETNTTSQATEYVAPKKRCSIIIECHTLLDHMDELNRSVAGFVPSDGIILRETYYEFDGRCTAFDVLKAVCEENNIALEYSAVPAYNSYYVEGIAHLYEFDCGKLSGWMYGVNGKLAEYAANNYEVSDGDLIFFSYTCNIGNDLR